MRVIAFSCVHWMTRELQVDVYEYNTPLDYRPFLQLCKLIAKDPPDVVVNLGDFTETFYGDNRSLPPAYTQLEPDIHIIKLAGNHDRDDGQQYVTIDDVRYEHGHKLVPSMPGADASVDTYIERLRRNTESMLLVHGHSHEPHGGNGKWPLDVGSVTFSKTYGEIIDGKAEWKSLET
ncbi:hypothetical protein LCGC14_2052310 [marine sediment metagenome]|uniref:Calcineurin-like phosphoesterase domain-containing protein n=1 Tax=marine sediment metagenome TaxID=412755 RepID=A0A0F9ENK8_9ZZZZ